MEPRDTTDITRALCSAVHLDGTFAVRVANLLMRRDLRAIAPSVGVDLRPVLRHSLAAQRHWQIYNARLVGILAITVALCFVSPWFLLVGPAGALGLRLADQLRRLRLVARRLNDETFRRQPNPPDEIDLWVEDRLDDIDEAQRGNVTVFSGYRPFVGHGQQLNSWSFALPLVAPAGLDGQSSKGSVTPFTARELTDYIAECLSNGNTTARPSELGSLTPGLLVEHRVFVDGASIAGDKRFLKTRTEPPLVSIDVQNLVGDITDEPRHYLCAHALSRGGHVVTSAFLRFATDGQFLYAECDRTVLGPVLKALQPVEWLNDSVPSAERRWLIRVTLRQFLPDLLKAPYRLVTAVNVRSRYYRAAIRARQEAEHYLHFDYGAALSVREMVADSNYHNDFQRSDAQRYMQLVERQVLDALTEFLKQHNVDTSELRNRQLMILNEGVIQTGGTSNVGVQAVGRMAMASARQE